MVVGREGRVRVVTALFSPRFELMRGTHGLLFVTLPEKRVILQLGNV